jgi:hypothetical protein
VSPNPITVRSFFGELLANVIDCRLKKTGVMSVKNPAEAAYQEGRVVELDDDAKSE